MAASDDTEIGGQRASLPTTHWSLLDAIHDAPTAEHRVVLNFLIGRYWKPVYCYVRRKGWDNEQAKDLAQDFFTAWLVGDLFRRADRDRGSFRSLLVTSLDHFLSNARRAARARRRCPSEGFVSIHQLATDHPVLHEPVVRETPEAAFRRAWLSELLMRVITSFENECRATGKEVHFKLFNRRVIEPALEGSTPPPLTELAVAFGLTEKEAGNRLVTARRAFQRLLRDDIRSVAMSDDDIAGEIRDLFAFVAAR